MGNKKEDPRRAGFAVLLGVVLLVCLAATVLPGGAKANWQKAFRFFGLGNFSACADGYPLAVHVLDVGKADSIFVECEGHSLLVDGGTPDHGDDVVTYLKRRGVTSLDCVVNSHPDSDHIGGLKAVLQSCRVRRYLCPDLPQSLIPKAPEYSAVQSALKTADLMPEHPKAGDFFRLGTLGVSVLGPVRPGNSTNNNSIILRLAYGKTSFLLVGDAEKAEEESLLASGENFRSDVLKVGHHGSDTSTTQNFLQAVKPKYAVISVGNDSNDLPKLAVSKRLADAGVSVFRTDVSGTVVFLSDGNAITVKTEKS